MRLLAIWPWPWPWFSPYPTGHIGPHSDAIRVSQQLLPLLPPRWTQSFVGLCWLRSSSSLLVDLVLSCILVPASTVLAVVCAGGPYGRHVQASELSEVVFLSVCCPWFVVQFWFWPIVIPSFHKMPSWPIAYFSAICDVQHPDFLADRTNGRGIATLLCLSVVCDVMYCG